LKLKFKTALTAPEDFIKSVYEIDKQVYSPELAGLLENLYKRYGKCKDSFVLIYDEECNQLVGYVNFFPIASCLHKEMNTPENHEMRDDDIEPFEMHDWRLERPNHLFIISVAIIPEYRKGEAIILLGNSLLSFLREKDAKGYRIHSIAGSAISEGGENFLKRFRASYVKEIEGGYKYYYADEASVRRLIEDGLLL
jgi:hypothetical protein